jgi:teichuronic acid biosynthesis glycosyltransferase TuaH
MNIIIFPFHDMRKNQREGFRNRDSHFIEQLSSHEDLQKILIINRPVTVAELIYKKASWKTAGEVISQTSRTRLVKTHANTYVLDYLSRDVVGNITQKKAWYWKAYGSREFIRTIHNTLHLLDIAQYVCLFQCLYASSVLGKLTPQYTVFDADDNWLRFPAYRYMYRQIRQGYADFALNADWWITNSEENRTYFYDQFHVNRCDVIKNGVEIERFQRAYPVPPDIVSIQKPVIGFGGSISHLIDVDLINQITADHSDKNFVLLGQILNKSVFNLIQKRSNLFYLGDKHYDLYPAYVAHFDVCIIPYVIGSKTHGGDALKFYEYLAAGKKVVSTNGNGVFQANTNVYLADTHAEFSFLISQALLDSWQPYIVPAEFTWKYKTDRLVDQINHLTPNHL